GGRRRRAGGRIRGVQGRQVGGEYRGDTGGGQVGWVERSDDPTQVPDTHLRGDAVSSLTLDATYALRHRWCPTNPHRGLRPIRSGRDERLHAASVSSGPLPAVPMMRSISNTRSLRAFCTEVMSFLR